MEYRGRYSVFDAGRIRTYPLAGRANKVKLASLVWPDSVLGNRDDLIASTRRKIRDVAGKILEARRKDRAVICFTGAHLIKNGMGPLLADLVERGLITLVGGNGATGIHDFELAEIGETSENVPNALPKGRFGMAYEFAFINAALKVGNDCKLGYGESLGRTMLDAAFRRKVAAACVPRMPRKTRLEFRHPEASVLARCYKCNVPMTILAGIGTDVLDQHASFDGEAKGGTSGRDFLIYAREARRLSGGVVLNIGSAVTGPEVLLKALSMSSNVGQPAKGITTADFDLRPDAKHQRTESDFGYYFRDQKSVVLRIPEAFGGKGFYIQGNHTQTVPALYCALRELTKD
ncbi:MAG: hypothetical protein C0404_15040 [Verrucomicrobia bacterium]|nr:hypothetical protein [Verrucomicrobiota bacterium]